MFRGGREASIILSREKLANKGGSRVAKSQLSGGNSGRYSKRTPTLAPSAASTLVRRGRTVAVARSSVHQGDDELTTGLFTYLFLDDPATPDRQAGPGSP